MPIINVQMLSGRTREQKNGFMKEVAAIAAIAVAAVVSVAGVCAADAEADRERAFTRENQAAMDTMMTRMTVASSGDVDRDFVAMMVPHHEGAIAMAKSELRFGRNERLRRLAQEIIVDQSQEITAMNAALATREAPAAP